MRKVGCPLPEDTLLLYRIYVFLDLFRRNMDFESTGCCFQCSGGAGLGRPPLEEGGPAACPRN